jgi:hypothetical protein
MTVSAGSKRVVVTGESGPVSRSGFKLAARSEAKRTPRSSELLPKRGSAIVRSPSGFSGSRTWRVPRTKLE